MLGPPRIPKKEKSNASDSDGEKVDNFHLSLRNNESPHITSATSATSILGQPQQLQPPPLRPPTYGTRNRHQGSDSLMNYQRYSYSNSSYNTNLPTQPLVPSITTNSGSREVSNTSQSSRTANMQAKRVFVSPEILLNEDPHNLAVSQRRTTRSAKKDIKKAPETVDLLSSSDDDGDIEELHEVSVVGNSNSRRPAFSSSTGSVGTRPFIAPQRFPLESIHFGLLEIKTNNDNLCTLALLGSANDMIWRFHWYVNGISKETDLLSESFTSFRYFLHLYHNMSSLYILLPSRLL